MSDHDNKLTGPDAVKFFERSQLPRPVLAKVWALADNARKGYLDQVSFAKVSLAQLSFCRGLTHCKLRHACIFQTLIPGVP